jgi:hypothetical protein
MRAFTSVLNVSLLSSRWTMDVLFIGLLSALGGTVAAATTASAMYLITLCTLHRRDALARALAGTEAELGLLQGRTATDLWLADIARVEAAYAEQG